MIFLDSSLMVAYSNEADENHEKALKIDGISKIATFDQDFKRIKEYTMNRFLR